MYALRMGGGAPDLPRRVGLVGVAVDALSGPLLLVLVVVVVVLVVVVLVVLVLVLVVVLVVVVV